jgi:alpha-N-arabinofuranosidase
MTVPVEIRGAGVKTVTGTVLHADSLQAHNTFSRPDAVKPAVFKAFGVRGSKITVKMPPASIVVLAIK